MKKFFKQLFWMIPVIALLVSCFPEFDATTEELDVAITRVDDNQDFTNYHTFFLYDTVMHITDDEDEDVEGKFDDQIISEVRQHFLDLGWTEIKDTTDLEDQADVSIMLSALAVDIYFYYYYWWDWWYWYPWDWWFPGYPGYPIYPGYPTYPTYGYSVGTVMIDMADMTDLNRPRSDEEIPKVKMLWTGAVNGLLVGSDDYISSRLTKQIDQVFKQSPYLSKTSPAN